MSKDKTFTNIFEQIHQDFQDLEQERKELKDIFALKLKRIDERGDFLVRKLFSELQKHFSSDIPKI